jgi:hypothetical protein
MTQPRHRSYRHVKELVGSAQLDSEERWQLIDAAEGLLLAPGDETEETGRLRSTARATLMLAVVGGRLSAAAARRMMSLIERCGPAPVAAGAPFIS